jgi:hypothetical protein
MDDLKSRFDAATEGIAPPPSDVQRVMARGRRARVWRGVAAVGATCLVVAAGVFGAVTLFSSDNEVAGSGDGYVFTFEILSYDRLADRVTVRYTSEWATDEYPGARDCTWTLYGRDGSLITESTTRIIQDQRVITRRTPIAADARPHLIEGSCGPRLDDTTYVVTVTSPRIEKLTKLVDIGLPGWAVIFDIEWSGNDQRYGSARCDYAIFAAEDGRLLREDWMTYRGPAGTIEQSLSRGFTNRPGRVEVHCVPFGEQRTEQVFEWTEIRFVDTPDEGGPQVETHPVWKGSIPPPAGLVLLCHVELTNGTGDVVYEGPDIELKPPKTEDGRQGPIVTFGLPGAEPGLREQDLTPKIECAPSGEAPQPSPPDTSTASSFARFATRYPETRRNPQEVIGVVEIDAEAGTICSSAYLPWARAAQVHMKVADTEFPGTDPVFITIFEPPTEFRATICREANPMKLAQILEDPAGFYIDYHEKDEGGMEARSEPLTAPSTTDG